MENKEHKQFDIVFREIIGSRIPKSLVKIISNKEPLRLIEPNLPKTIDRTVDTLIETKSGDILHIEIQSTNDSDMANRMLMYYVLLREKFKGKSIDQYVLYIGQDRCNMKYDIATDRLSYSYKLIDIKELPFKELIKSDNPTDILISGLIARTEEQIKDFLTKFKETLPFLPTQEQRLYLEEALTIYSLNPKLKVRLYEEVSMPVIITEEIIENDPFFKKGLEKGLEEGLQKGIEEGMIEDAKMSILDILGLRFGTEELSDIENRLNNIKDLEVLRDLRKKTLKVNSLEEFKRVLGSI